MLPLGVEDGAEDVLVGQALQDDLHIAAAGASRQQAAPEPVMKNK